ncbi:MAG: hypothetical protein FWC56_03650 [Phycisphaerae bacterium]|nr:hypothetical protein [Phycisphaerae bacterium]
MDEAIFKQQLNDLLKEINLLPENERQKLSMLAQQTAQRHEDIKKTVTNLHESVDFLRVSLKYLLFDLEATRRENKELRKMLDDRKNKDE